MRENLLVILLMCSTAFLASQTIVPKKCSTCGKSIIQCQYKGRHPVEREKSTTQSKQNQDKSSYRSSSSVSKNNSNRSQNIWVSFTCYADNVTIYIDGKYHGSIDKKVLLSKGSHKLKAVAPNYYTKEMTFEVNNNNYVVHISLELEKPNSQPAQETKTQPAQTSKPASGYENGHQWVDLGLSVKWATCNVGADRPSDYGGYYAWGETCTKSRYDWNNYFDCLDSRGYKQGTYNWRGGQNRITPTSGHDTARENWGGKWRMPTDAENEELCKRCTWTRVTMNGHKGYQVTGGNGNSIFLPLAGYCYGTGTYLVGECGFIWSSSLSTDENARYLEFGSWHQTDSRYVRRDGRSVRPVTE